MGTTTIIKTSGSGWVGERVVGLGLSSLFGFRICEEEIQKKGEKKSFRLSLQFPAMVTDQEIATGVETLLRQSPANAVNSLNGVVQQLGARFGQDLSHKTALIHQEILRYHQFPPPPPPALASFSKDRFALQHPPQFLNFNHQFPSHLAFNLPAGFQGPYPHPPSPPVLGTAVQIQQPPQKPPPPPQPKNAKGTKESGQAGTKRRGGAGGLNKVCGVSPELQAVVGDAALPRTQIVKQLWAYIRKHNLQDPSNKRKIICDETLRIVFETDSTDMFQMNKLLSKHIHSLDSPKESTSSKRMKIDVDNPAENHEPVDSLVTISEPLAMFLATGKKEMLRSEATQYILGYIKVNQLEDPNTETVQCDLKLRELFGCEYIHISDVRNILSRHHLSKSNMGVSSFDDNVYGLTTLCEAPDKLGSVNFYC
ncbi:hypothetical protein V2J09_003290 [Rumex salicifolius]